MYRDAIERKDRDTDDDDQHHRHIGKNDAVRVAPERFDRLCDLSSHHIRTDGSDRRTSMRGRTHYRHGPCNAVPNDKLYASRPLAPRRVSALRVRVSTHSVLQPCPVRAACWIVIMYRCCQDGDTADRSGWCTDYCYPCTPRSQSVGANCGALPPTAGIGKKTWSAFGSAATECIVRGLPGGNGRGAVLRCDSNRLVQPGRV